ncbi:MAG: hypothetical protein LBJ63_05325 [Prevotellaceae bacterium]|nr:hypothetical protein [Prevotellaceae bacterium]
MQNVPFETVRFEKLDDDGNFNRLATHPDWGRRHQALRRFKKEDIKFFNFYNPDPIEIEKQVNIAGGWENWNGQIYYYSEDGKKTYPLSIYDAVLTDMSTEEGIGNVKYRNARSNFFPAGMLIDKRNKPQTDDQEDTLEKTLLEAQTDEKACKIIKVEVESEEEKPEFVPFETKNYDKEFDYSEKSIQQNIGRKFNQPPILRAEDVGGNFGADLMTNAYDAYNSITSSERLNVERVFAEIFSCFWTIVNPTNNYTVTPLRYEAQLDISNMPVEILGVMTSNEKRRMLGLEELDDSEDNQVLLAEKVGVGGMQVIAGIVADVNLSDEQKRAMLEIFFKLSVDETLRIIPNVNNS